MGPRIPGFDDQSTADSTPEDVAVLYWWANLQGAKYRDYSASRREHRAQVRYRAARAALERELKAQVDAETAAPNGSERGSGKILGSSLPMGEAERRAGRVESARRTEAAARAAVLALREEREVVEAHSSAKRQAQVYQESELRRLQLAGPQPHGQLGERYDEPGDLRSDEPNSLQHLLYRGSHNLRDEDHPLDVGLDGTGDDREQDISSELEQETSAPAWLLTSPPLPRPAWVPATTHSFRNEVAGGDTLQDFRELVAARWFALKDVFDYTGPELPAMQTHRPRTEQPPLNLVFSLAGGVGKTSLVAALSRSLANEGEKVLVADTTSQGLLPIYFCSDRRARREDAPSSSEVADSPVFPVAVQDFSAPPKEAERGPLAQHILQGGEGRHRILMDSAPGATCLLHDLIDFLPTVLVPMAPDMNSVVSLPTIERIFRGIVDRDGRSLVPFYVLNQFDASLPLHLDVREVMRRRLGNRLLRTSIRRSPLVSEALADGMTVLDYAPEAAVSQDYRDIASWLRTVSPPPTQESHPRRWGEG